MPAAPDIEQVCTEHPHARAGWSCGACGRLLCPECVGDKRLRQGSVTLCMHCGGLAAKLTRPRRIEPYWEMFPRFLSALLSWEGLVQLLAVGGFMYLLSWIPLIGRFLAGFVYVSYYFRVISHAAGGGERLPEPEDFLGWESIFSPIIRFMVASATIWAPAAIYVAWGMSFDGLMARGLGVLLDPVLFLLVAAGLFYFPAAIIAAAVADSVVAVVNPLITVRLMLRIPTQYMVTWAVWAGLSVLDVVLRGGLTAASSAVKIPIFSELMVTVVGLFVPVLTGLVLGRLIYQNAEEFGLLGAGDDVEEQWPEASPQGVLSLETKGADKRPHVEPVAVEGWEAHAEPARAPPPEIAVPQPTAQPAPWAPSPMGFDHEPMDLGLHTPTPVQAPPGPRVLESVTLGDAEGGAPLEVVHDTQSWLTDSAAGPTAPWAAGPDTTVAVDGGAWREEVDESTELELELDSLGSEHGPSAERPQDGLLAAAQVGPASELRAPGPVQAARAPLSMPPAAPPAPAVVAGTPLATSEPALDLSAQVIEVAPNTSSAPVVDDGAHLRFALEQGDAPAVVELVGGLDLSSIGLGPRLELRLAGILEREGAFEAAVKACQRAVDEAPTGGFAPRALYMGGRILAERLENPGEAKRYWAYLVQRFPQEQLAEIARTSIARLG